jgi:hypothetical protein
MHLEGDVPYGIAQLPAAANPFGDGTRDLPVLRRKRYDDLEAAQAGTASDIPHREQSAN